MDQTPFGHMALPATMMTPAWLRCNAILIMLHDHQSGGCALAGADVKRAGLATHYIPSAALPDVEAELRRQGAYMRDFAAVDRTLSAFEVCSQPIPDTGSTNVKHKVRPRTEEMHNSLGRSAPHCSFWRL